MSAVENGVGTIFSYHYDEAGRLSEVKKDGMIASSYAYDSNGNRTQATKSGVIANATYDAQDRLATYGTKSYTYTMNGEVSTITDAAANTSRTFTYNSFGKLKTANVAGKSVEYLLDAQNRSIGKRINGAMVQGFMYLNQIQIGAEFDGNNNLVAIFTYGKQEHSPDYMVKGDVHYRIITDQLGSVRYVVNTVQRTIAQEMDYDEFGNVIKDTNPGFQPFGYAGGLYNRDTGLVKFGARCYDPEKGRWTSKGPVW